MYCGISIQLLLKLHSPRHWLVEKGSACLENALFQSLDFFFVKNFIELLLKQGSCVQSVCTNTWENLRVLMWVFTIVLLWLANRGKQLFEQDKFSELSALELGVTNDACKTTRLLLAGRALTYRRDAVCISSIDSIRWLSAACHEPDNYFALQIPFVSGFLCHKLTFLLESSETVWVQFEFSQCGSWL